MWEKLNRAAILVAIVTFGFNGATSVTCFSTGQFCEYAVIGPSERGVVENHLQQLADSIDKIELSVSDKQMLFGDGRIDLYAAAGNRSFVIGSYSKQQVESYTLSAIGKWAVIFENRKSGDENEKHFDITLYDTVGGLSKNTITVSCTNYDVSPTARFLNASYDSENRLLVFDLVSTCRFVQINGLHYLMFDAGRQSGRAIISFDEKHFVTDIVGTTDGRSGLPQNKKQLYTDAEISIAHKGGELDREACLTKLMASKSNAGFEECRAPWHLASRAGDPDRKEFVYFGASATTKGRQIVVRSECIEDSLRVENLGSQLFAMCRHNMGGANPYSFISIAGASEAGTRFEVNLSCECYGFETRAPKFVANNRVQFELLANAETINMDSLSIPVAGVKPPSDRYPGAFRGVYELTLSDGGAAQSLTLVGKAGK